MGINENNQLGQFIPLHYHYNMLFDPNRMVGFKEAINYIVKPNDTVLELGSGTGPMSFFAAQKAKKVISVEFNPELVAESKRLLGLNSNTQNIQVINDDASTFVPNEPVDVVICEMLHVGLLREKQLPVLNLFKENYKSKFDKLPVFIPGATLQAVQLVQHDFIFEGYYAPVTLFQDAYTNNPRTVGLSEPVIYHQVVYEEPYNLTCKCDDTLAITEDGTLNAIRVITKSVLAATPEKIIDWFNLHLIVPLGQEIAVKKGQQVNIKFEYEGGATLSALQPIISVL